MNQREASALAAGPSKHAASGPLRLSIIVEWENTRLNGVPRAWALLDALGRQWQAIAERRHPVTLPPEVLPSSSASRLARSWWPSRAKP